MSDNAKEDTLIGQLYGILEEGYPVELESNQFNRDTDILKLGLDSLTILDLLYDIESEIGVHLEAKDVLNIRTVGELTDLLIKNGA